MGEPQRAVGSTENGQVLLLALTVRNGIPVSTLCAVRSSQSYVFNCTLSDEEEAAMQDCSNRLYQADSYLIESVKYVFRFDLEHLEVSPYSSIAFDLSHVRQYLLRLTPMLPINALA